MTQPSFRTLILPLSFVIQALMLAGPAFGLDVLLSRYDFSGTGANLGESLLAPLNISSAKFGRLFSLPVEGKVYAQPLYVENLAIGTGVHNVLFVATMDDVVYAVDGDNGSLFWRKNLVPVNASPFPIVDATNTNSLNIAGNVGIESTPVIDRSRNTLYLVARTKESGSSVFRLHAIDLATGSEKAGSPVQVTGVYQAPGGNTVNFDSGIQNQRASLTVAKGKVLVSFGSHEDLASYHGWLMAYDLDTLAQVGVRVLAPSAGHAAVWMSGRAPAVDTAGNVYLTTGNGLGANGYDGATNFGESVVKLDLSQGIQVTDWFTPANWSDLDHGDVDFGSSGPLLIPGTSQLISGGKDGRLFRLSQTQLGKNSANDSGALQVAQFPSDFRSGPVIWSRPTAGSLLFTSLPDQELSSYPLSSSGIIAMSNAKTASGSGFGYPGGNLAISANGEQAGTGIVWSYGPRFDPDHEMTPGELRAFDASSLGLLWSSLTNPGRDDAGLFSKYVAPLVVNGKVYLATNSNQVVVYGQLTASPDFAVSVLPARQPTLGGSAHFDLNSPSLNGFSGNVSWAVSGLPMGSSTKFTTVSATQAGLDITIPTDAAAGTYRLTVTANSAGLSHIQQAILDVTATQVVSRTLVPWSILSFDSQETVLENGFASNAIDGDASTIWHTQWSGSIVPSPPHELVIDLSSVQKLSGLSYLPRQDGIDHGNIRQFEVYASTDGNTWSPEISGGSFDYSNHDPDNGMLGIKRRQQITLDGTPGRYVKFRANSEISSSAWSSAAEINLYTDSANAATPSPTSTPTPTPSPTAGTIAPQIVQSNSAAAFSDATAVSVTFQVAPKIGNHVVAFCANWSPSSSAPSIADNGGAAYTLRATSASADNQIHLDGWTAPVAASIASYTVTCSWAAGNNGSLAIYEVSGVDPAVLDGVAGSAVMPSGTSFALPAVTTSTNSLVFAAVSPQINSNPAFSAGANWTLGEHQDNNGTSQALASVYRTAGSGTLVPSVDIAPADSVLAIDFALRGR
jgi:hypothetical protein